MSSINQSIADAEFTKYVGTSLNHHFGYCNSLIADGKWHSLCDTSNLHVDLCAYVEGVYWKCTTPQSRITLRNHNLHEWYSATGANVNLYTNVIPVGMHISLPIEYKIDGDVSGEYLTIFGFVCDKIRNDHRGKNG